MNQPPDPSDAELVRLLARSGALDDAPEQVVRRAIGLWQAPQPATGGVWQRLLAALTFDSAGAPALAFGMRAGASAVRQLLYSVDGHDIDLRVKRRADGGGYDLSGQVLGPRGQGTVRAEGSSQQVEAALDELGEFRLPALAPGDVRLAIEAGALRIELPPLHLPG